MLVDMLVKDRVNQGLSAFPSGAIKRAQKRASQPNITPPPEIIDGQKDETREAERPLPEGWEVVAGEDGESYYYNAELQKSQWHHPEDEPEYEMGEQVEMFYEDHAESRAEELSSVSVGLQVEPTWVFFELQIILHLLHSSQPCHLLFSPPLPSHATLFRRRLVGPFDGLLHGEDGSLCVQPVFSAHDGRRRNYGRSECPRGPK
jgi:hypothetical protein